MECAHPKVAGLGLTHELANAFFHFPRRLVGEGECEDLKRIHSRTKQMSDAVGQHPRFARTRACDDHHRAVHGLHGFKLGFVQCF